jgi:hypothetical protein
MIHPKDLDLESWNVKLAKQRRVNRCVEEIRESLKSNSIIEILHASRKRR